MDSDLATVFAEKLDLIFQDIEAAWGLIANANGGDWNKDKVWKKHAERWRDGVWNKINSGVYRQ